MINILYVEDDESLGFVTKDHLEHNGYKVDHAENGRVAMDWFSERNYDLCILDVMLPEMDGFEIAKNIRKVNAAIPILFLTARTLKEDRIKGFKLGGDDYITKPYSIEELVLKIQVFLRRKQIDPSKQKEQQYKIGKYVFRPEDMSLSLDDELRQLTMKEVEVLRFFVEHPNQIISRSDILISVWGKDDYFLGRSLDVFISKLRKYLMDDKNIEIQNIHGVGFKFLVK